MIEFDENNNIIENSEASAILVGLQTDEDISYSMEELEGLAEAAGAKVLGSMVQNAERVNSATYIGKGKLEELASFAENMEADLVIFNDELSGMQIRNIEDAIKVKVIDRTMLVLDIFASRATSREGKLQVELAQLKYRMPRLLGFGKSLSRLGGGIGTRGPGEKKLETDRRHIQSRIDEIRRELKELQGSRGIQRAKRERSELPIVALVGYTNAGKSSIMNRLLSMSEKEDKQVFEKDMLFATLDTSQRLITLEDGKQFILIDTVGFVSKLPHGLIEAFKSTLEELQYADLLIHVADASFKDVDFHIGVTEGVLKELGVDSKPICIVFNKIDKNPDFSALSYPGSILVSAKYGMGLDELISTLRSEIFADVQTCELLVPFSRGDVVSYLLGKSEALETEYRAEGTYLKIDLGEADRNRFREFMLQ